MWQRLNLAWLIIAFVVLRLVSMIWVPLADTSEPRYAEIARLMAVSNDWITPYFEPGVPFWGKPPLSFWTQAISFKIFGINEFAARLPSLLATLATAWMLWLFAMFSGGRRVAGYTAVIYGSGALVFVTAGAVLTDPFLVLGTTWSMAAFFLAPKHNSWFWRYGFFLGLAIGLLSKGPLAPVLTFGPIVIWLIQSPTRRVYVSALPWLKGLLLMLVISLPWYVAAELKTPGFLNYFIVGEHFMRFIDPGWSGDLYGNAHNQPKGMIWPQWFVASFPWGLIAIAMLLWQLRARQGRTLLKQSIKSPLVSYLLLWSVFTPLFFTFSGNILWTYVLPAIPAFTILLALALEHGGKLKPSLAANTLAASLLVPLVSVGLAIAVIVNPDLHKSEKGLIEFVEQDKAGRASGDAGPDKIYYLYNLPFSARFYSHGSAEEISFQELTGRQSPSQAMYVAIRPRNWSQVTANVPYDIQKRYENGRHILAELPAL